MTQEEHNFKAGDWIKEKSTSRTLRVLEVTECGYKTNLANYNRIQFSVERYFKKIKPPKEYEKLLYRDLCARIPYGVKVEIKDDNGGFSTSRPVKLLRGGTFENGQKYFITTYYGFAHEVNELLPYLRPLSSMTEEEEMEFQEINLFELPFRVDGLDWLNEHHFDYRGLLEVGLAVEIK